jgi:hypothetical protein
MEKEKPENPTLNTKTPNTNPPHASNPSRRFQTSNLNNKP